MFDGSFLPLFLSTFLFLYLNGYVKSSLLRWLFCKSLNKNDKHYAIENFVCLFVRVWYQLGFSDTDASIDTFKRVKKKDKIIFDDIKRYSCIFSI